MKRFFFLSILLANSAFSQSNINLNSDFISGSANELIYKSLSKGVYVLQSNYVLYSPKTKNEYGRSKQSYFDRKFAITIPVNGKLLLPTQASEPWKNNAEISQIDSLIPKLQKIETRLISDKDFSKVTFKFDSLQKKYFIDTDVIYEKTFGMANNKPTNGFLLLFHQKTLDSLSIAASIKKVNLNWEDSSKIEIKNYILQSDKFLGGILFDESIGLGQISYSPLAYYEQINSKWVLTKLFTTPQKEKNSIIDITPIEKKNIENNSIPKQQANESETPKQVQNEQEVPKMEEKGRKKKKKEN